MNTFLKCGGEGMLTMVVMLHYWTSKNEYAPINRTLREGVVLIVSVSTKGETANQGYCRGVTLLSTAVGINKKKNPIKWQQ